jgi:glucokinase
MSLAIGIDIGGTHIKGALFDVATGECLDRRSTLTLDGVRLNDVLPWAAGTQELISQFERGCGAAALPVGLAAPGLASADGRRIDFMPGRMDGLAGFDWPAFLRREVRVLNDAHAALLGEIWLGAARGLRDVVLLTLGTGVGGAVVAGGRLLRGHIGRAGHLGHLSLDPHGARDICRTPGSLEDAIGNATVPQRSGGRFKNTRELIDAAATGDSFAEEVWRESIRALAAGIASLINVFDPACVLLGGGIAAGARNLLLDPLRQWLDEFEWRPGGHGARVSLAALGEWAGAHGAAWNVTHPDEAA